MLPWSREGIKYLVLLRLLSQFFSSKQTIWDGMYTHLGGCVGPLCCLCLAFITVSKAGISELSASVHGCSRDEGLYHKHPCHNHQRPSLPRDAIIHSIPFWSHACLLPLVICSPTSLQLFQTKQNSVYTCLNKTNMDGAFSTIKQGGHTPPK